MAKFAVDDASKQEIGQSAEDEFDKIWMCAFCDCKFVPQPPPEPDRVCPKCGIEIDVKGAPEAQDYGTITISQIPFEKWHSGVIIAWRPRPGSWYGTRKYFCNAEGPFPPAQDGKRPTPFYKIPLKAFRHDNGKPWKLEDFPEIKRQLHDLS